MLSVGLATPAWAFQGRGGGSGRGGFSGGNRGGMGGFGGLSAPPGGFGGMRGGQRGGLSPSPTFSMPSRPQGQTFGVPGAGNFSPGVRRGGMGGPAGAGFGAFGVPAANFITRHGGASHASRTGGGPSVTSGRSPGASSFTAAHAAFLSHRYLGSAGAPAGGRSSSFVARHQLPPGAGSLATAAGSAPLRQRAYYGGNAGSAFTRQLAPPPANWRTQPLTGAAARNYLAAHPQHWANHWIRHPYGWGFGLPYSSWWWGGRHYPWYRPRYHWLGGYGWWGGYPGYGWYGGWGYPLGYNPWLRYRPYRGLGAGFGVGYGYQSGGASSYAYGSQGGYMAGTALNQPPTDASEANTAAKPIGDPEAAKVFAGQGEADFKAGNYQAAAYAWRHALADDPENGVLVLLLAQAFFAQGQFNEAAGAVQHAMMLLPDDQWNVVVKNYEELYSSRQAYTDQLRALEQARKANPEDPALRFLLGYHYGFLGYPEHGVRELQQTLVHAPKDGMAQALMDVLQGKKPVPEPPDTAQDAEPSAAGGPAETVPSEPETSAADSLPVEQDSDEELFDDAPTESSAPPASEPSGPVLNAPEGATP